jgi:hypothetical protein
MLGLFTGNVSSNVTNGFSTKEERPMKFRLLVSLMALGALILQLAACGGGGGGSAPPAVTVNISKGVAITNTDSVTLSATLPAAATAVTTVTFTASGSGVLSSATATVAVGDTKSGDVTLTNATASSVTVIATAPGFSGGSKTVAFVTAANAPTRSEISVRSLVAMTDIVVFGSAVNVATTATNAAVLNTATPSVLAADLLAIVTANPGIVGYAPVVTGANPVDVSLYNGKATKQNPPTNNLPIVSVAANSNFIKLNYDLTYDGTTPAIPAFTTANTATIVWDAAGALTVPSGPTDSDIVLTVDYFNAGGTKLNP